LYDRDAPEVGLRCVNLGLVLQDLCRLGEAIPLFERAIAIDRSHQLILQKCQDLGTLAEALRNAGRNDDAEAAAYEALQSAERSSYGEHPVCASLKTNLARILEDRDQVQPARTLLESSLSITVACFGDDSPHLAACFGSLGVNSLCSGHYETAIVELTRALEIEKRRRASNKQKVGHRELGLGAAYLVANDPEKARIHLLSGWNHREEGDVPDVLDARLLLVRLAAALLAGESTALFAGQIATLLDEDYLPAPGVNVRWSLEPLLCDRLGRYSANAREIWSAACRAVHARTQTGPSAERSGGSGVPKRGLNEPWPNV
jgi:tetratricopeptide (TPR) repeat protein